jgi:hypothetical protein
VNQKPKILTAKSFKYRFVGLMGRTVWPGDFDGIYFPRCRSVHTFFTFLNPDLLFLDKNHKILRVHLSAKSWLVFVGPVNTYGCLEIPREASRRLGLKEGDVIDWLRQ